jgi:hypothetical protein
MFELLWRDFFRYLLFMNLNTYDDIIILLTTLWYPLNCNFFVKVKFVCRIKRTQMIVQVLASCYACMSKQLLQRRC